MYEIDFEVLGQPIGKGRPRFTKSGHTYTPEKTREYEKRIRAAAWQRMQQLKVEPTLCHVHIDLIAYMQIPKSWSKRKKVQAECGVIRPKMPDIDNILKACLDGIQGPIGPIIYNDSQCHSVKARKVYANLDDWPRLAVKVRWEQSRPV
jgi:Holliday junction resolvase RusA-like endonuclease